MRGVPGLAHVVNTAAIARPEIVVTPKPDQAARAGGAEPGTLRNPKTPCVSEY